MVIACYFLDQHQYGQHIDMLQRLMQLGHVGTLVCGYTAGAEGKNVGMQDLFEADYGYR